MIASIAQGLVVLLGVAKGDSEADVSYMADKIPQIRIFSDEAGKMNRSIMEVKGELLIVSQFTLLGRYPSWPASGIRCRRGRPIPRGDSMNPWRNAIREAVGFTCTQASSVPTWSWPWENDRPGHIYS